MKHFLTLFFTALLAMTASGAANVGVGSLPVLSSFTNGQYLVIATGNSSNSPLRLVPFSAVSNGWLSVQKFTDGLLAPSSNLTNYTVTATVAERTINATNNIHFSSVSGGSSGQKMFPSFTVTNFSGADRLLTFASGWTAYGSPTNTISSGKTARVMFEVEGSNVRYGVVIEGESGSGGGSVTGTYSFAYPLSLSGTSVTLRAEISGLTNFSASISNVVYLNGASNIVQVLSNAVNNTRYVLARDVFTVTPSKVRSNGLGAINMFHKTNIIVEGDQSVIDGSAALGELLYITNSANITIRGIEFRGRVVTNTTLVSGIGHVWGAVSYHNVREFRFLNNRVIDHHDHGILDLGSQGGAWAISTNTFINYNFFDNIGSARTNEVIVKDGTAIVPSGGEVIGNYIQNSLRGIEPYIDNSNNPPINQNCIVRGNHIVNMIDDAILTAGNTNMHGLIIEDNVIEWYPGYTRRGSNVITSASGININGGQNVKIVRNRIYYAPNFDIDVPGNFEKFGFVIEDNSGYGYFYGASGGGGLEVTSSSARMPNRGFSIKNNKFEFKRSFGIGLTGIRDSEISGNKLVNTGLDSTRQIWLYSDATTICSNLVLFGNHITSDERDTPTTSGIEIENLTLNTLLAANTIYGQATNVHNLAGAEVTQYNFDASSTNRFAAIRDLGVLSNALYSAIGSGSATTNGTAVIASGTLVSSNRVDIGSAQQFSIFQSGGFFQLTDNTSGAALISADDSSGEVFLGTDSITPLISFQAPVDAGGNAITNVASVQIQGTGESMISVASYQGDSFALARRTNAPSATGTTNYFELDRGSLTAGQLLAVHSVSSGVVVFTNATASSSGGMVSVAWTDNSSSNPLDSTDYLLGMLGGGMTTSGNWDYVKRYCPKTGTINLAEIRVRTSGTLGSGESVTFYVRKNDTTDSTSWTGTFDAVAKVIRVTNLAFSVTKGDEIAIKLTSPAWATNPTTVRTDAVLYVE